MAERTPPSDRDLIGDLRRVDEAFAHLKAGRSDVVDRLLAGDTDELVRQSERRQRTSHVRHAATVVGAFALAVATVVAVRALPGPDAPDAVALTTTTPATTTPATMTPALPTATPETTTPALPTTTPAPTTAPAMIAPPPATVVATPALRRLPGRTTSSDGDGALAAMGDAGLQPLARPTTTGPSTTEAAGLMLDAVGMAVPVVLTPGDDDVDAALRGARREAARGALVEAIAVLDALLARDPAPRVVDVVLVERARLQHRAGRDDDACATLATHRARFPTSDAAALVDAEHRRWSCP
jgi:hypothetical protein